MEPQTVPDSAEDHLLTLVPPYTKSKSESTEAPAHCLLPFVLSTTFGYFCFIAPTGQPLPEIEVISVKVPQKLLYGNFKLYPYSIQDSNSSLQVEGITTLMEKKSPEEIFLHLPIETLKEGFYQLGAQIASSSDSRAKIFPFTFFVRKLPTDDFYYCSKTISNDFTTICANSKIGPYDLQQEVENIQKFCTYGAKFKSMINKFIPERLYPDVFALEFWKAKLDEVGQDRSNLWLKVLPPYLEAIVERGKLWMTGLIWGYMSTEDAEKFLIKQKPNAGLYILRLGKSTPRFIVSGVKPNGTEVQHHFGDSIEDSVKEYANVIGTYVKPKLVKSDWARQYEAKADPNSTYIVTEAFKIRSISRPPHKGKVTGEQTYIPVEVPNPIYRLPVKSELNEFSMNFKVQLEATRVNLIVQVVTTPDVRPEFSVNLEKKQLDVKVVLPALKVGDFVIEEERELSSKIFDFTSAKSVSKDKWFVNPPVKLEKGWYLITVAELRSDGIYKFPTNY